MRKQQKETLENVIRRVFRNEKQGERYMKEMCMLVSSTCGPIIISSMIEHGLLQYRNIKRNKKVKKNDR